MRAPAAYPDVAPLLGPHPVETEYHGRPGMKGWTPAEREDPREGFPVTTMADAED